MQWLLTHLTPVVLFALGIGIGAEFVKRDRLSLTLMSLAAGAIYLIVYFLNIHHTHHIPTIN